MQWYYSKNGTQLGPVAQGELVSKLASGEVSSSDLVWKDGMADWIPASQVAELRVIADVPASPAVSAGPGAPVDSPYVAPASYPLPPASRSAVAGKASTSMTLGIIAIVTGVLCGCIGGIPCGILAVVFGNQYKKAAETDQSLLPELGKAKSGVLMGWIGIALALIMTVIGVMIQIAAGAFSGMQNQ